MLRVSKIIILLLIPLMIASSAFAHGDQKSFEKVIGHYLVDIGYAPDDFIGQSATTFSFRLIDPKSREDVEFSDLWVRIEKGDQTDFATGIIKSSLGQTTMIYTFPKAGKYKLIARYMNKDQTLVEGEFPITVISQDTGSKNTNGQLDLDIKSVFIGLLGGFILGVFSLRVLKKK